MEALHDVVRAGKARYLGASSMYAWQFAKAQAAAERHGWTRFVSMQNHYNLLYREEEREMIPQCVDGGVAVIPWSPLARGLLAGNRTKEGERLTTRAGTDRFADALYDPEVDFAVVDAVTAVAAERGVPNAQVALAWLLHKPGVTAPIVGATKIEHVEDALAAAELRLSEDEIARLEAPYVPHRVAGHSTSRRRARRMRSDAVLADRSRRAHRDGDAAAADRDLQLVCGRLARPGCCSPGPGTSGEKRACAVADAPGWSTIFAAVAWPGCAADTARRERAALRVEELELRDSRDEAGRPGRVRQRQRVADLTGAGAPGDAGEAAAEIGAGAGRGGRRRCSWS